MCTVHDGRARGVLSCAGLGDETAVRLGPRLKLGAGGRSPIVSPGWWTDHPSAGAGPGCGEVGSGSLARSVVGLSKRRTSPEATEQGVFAPTTGYRSQAIGREPGHPAPPSPPTLGRRRREAKGVGRGSDPSPPTSMTETIGQREGSDPGSAGYFSTTSASAATTPSGPTNTGLMSSSFSLGANAVAIWDAATKVLASASLSAAGLPR